MNSGDGVDFAAFKDITGYKDWARIDDQFKITGSTPAQ